MATTTHSNTMDANNDQQYFSLKKAHLVGIIIMFFLGTGVQVGMTISRIDALDKRIETVEKTISEVTRLNTQIELLRKDIEYLNKRKVQNND